MPLTYRELIEQVRGLAAEHGDHILDLPAMAMAGGEDALITDLNYQPHEAVTEEYEAEPEQLYMGTNWD